MAFTRKNVWQQGGTFDNGQGQQVTVGGSFNTGGVNVSMGITSSGMEIGMQTNVAGNTYTFKLKIDSRRVQMTS